MIPNTLTDDLGSVKIKMTNANERKRIESQLEVQPYLERLNYAIRSGSTTIVFQIDRRVDENRFREHTNRFTISKLFPNENPVEVLKRELAKLTVREYIETVKDTLFPNKSEMRVFGKQFEGKDVFIKFRIELVSIAHASGNNFIFVMLFHFSERDFKDSDFPYKIS